MLRRSWGKQTEARIYKHGFNEKIRTNNRPKTQQNKENKLEVQTLELEITKLQLELRKLGQEL